MAEPITRPEFTETLNRLHERIDKISETGIKIEAAAQSMKEATDKICDCVYGNGKSGLMSRVTQLFERVSLHTKLIMFVMASIIGLAFYIIRESLAK